MDLSASPPRAGIASAWIVILGGVCAALHVGKLPPAITALQQALGMTLVQAGFLLSLVQLAGMTVGLVLGIVADGLGLKRSMVAGLALLALASGLGGFADGATALMALRALEGFGFLLVVLPAPGLVRQLVPAQRVNLMLGVWGAYMPLATALALLVGPLAIAAAGWRAWWWALAAVSGAMALVIARAVRSPPPVGPVTQRMHASALAAWVSRLQQTLAASGPWLVALAFAAYSSQWLAVIGFLPSIYVAAGLSGATTGVLTAVVAAANIVGNLAAGRRLHRGAAPERLLATGFVTMALCTVVAYAETPLGGAPQWLRFVAVVVFSAVGGLVPATLFALSMRVAPTARTLSSTVGWMQQWSAFGQFAGPPVVAWVTSRAGGWQYTWVATGACALAGLALTARIAAWLRRHPVAPAAAQRVDAAGAAAGKRG
jgi:MFS family permease